MKILQVLPALQMGGVERGTIEIARALTNAGIANAVASAGGPMVSQLEALGVKHYTLPLKSKNPFVIRANAKRLAEIATRDGFTLMHARSRAPAWSVNWASKISGIPWIATFHGVYGTDPKFLKIPYNRVMLKSSRTICVSDYVLKHVKETYSPNEFQLVRIHRGADTNVFFPGAVSREEIIATKNDDYKLIADAPVITLPGRLTFWKGQTVFLDAIAKMKHKKLNILFIGSDQGRREYSDDLRSRASRLSNETRVVFRDHEKAMQKVYAISDIVVNASSAQPEAFGRTIPEAQAMGCLVVATAHGGACETIRDGETGWLVSPGSSDELAMKLDEILDLSDEAKNRVREAAIKSVRDDFSVAKMCEKTLNLYREF